MSCYGCSPSTGTNASSILTAPPRTCVSQQPRTHSCSEFHFRSATSSCARRPASQPAHRNTARCGLSSDAHAGATRRRSGHRHAGAVRRSSVSLAFCCRRTCVRRQHLIVPPTNTVTAAARVYPQTSKNNSTNPSRFSYYTNPSLHAPAPLTCPIQHNITQTPHFVHKPTPFVSSFLLPQQRKKTSRFFHVHFY